MRTGHRFKPKVREIKPKEPDLTRTSRAQRALHQVRKTGTPEEISAMEGKVAEIHPDMLIERRRIS